MSQAYGGWREIYPRPQFKRDSYFPLIEGWTRNGEALEVPWEHTAEKKLIYRVNFTLPEGFAGSDDRVLLHFGAVDQQCRLGINGHRVGSHRGGYLPFSFDITEFLQQGENRLVLQVLDTMSTDFPYGKQSPNPHGMWYTPVSGIWQPVWLEAVPDRYRIEKIRITPDLTGIDLQVKSDARRVQVEIRDPEGREVLHKAIFRHQVRIEIPMPRLWTPDTPNLYTMTLRTDRDRVESYFALRKVSIRQFGGYSRVCLNGKPIFLHGILDQGYFQQGLYLPEDPEEYRRDIIRMKELGLNLMRKHLKIEPEIYYYECDRQGMLVMQDMVNSGNYHFIFDTLLPTFHFQKKTDRVDIDLKGRRHRQFCEDMMGTLNLLHNHPSIIGYTLFNEGWGQFDSDRLYEAARDRDPSRFYDSTSGWFAQHDSDAQSEHIYYRNKLLRAKRPERFLLLSECGGFSRKIHGHMHPGARAYGYGYAGNEKTLTDQMVRMYEDMVIRSMPYGLCGSILTQLSDVEGEINGLYTYNRQVCKVDKKRMRDISARVYKAYDQVIQRSKK